MDIDASGVAAISHAASTTGSQFNTAALDGAVVGVAIRVRVDLDGLLAGIDYDDSTDKHTPNWLAWSTADMDGVIVGPRQRQVGDRDIRSTDADKLVGCVVALQGHSFSVAVERPQRDARGREDETGVGVPAVHVVGAIAQQDGGTGSGVGNDLPQLCRLVWRDRDDRPGWGRERRALHLRHRWKSHCQTGEDNRRDASG